MAKASSSKKVQRAARAAASSRGTGETRERGFPILVAVVVLLGIGLVFAARGSRDEAVAPFLSDHWHSAYEVYDCGTSLPPIVNETDPDGIHTHGDGLLHIHPFNSSATGTDARLGVFFSASGLDANESTISSGEYTAIEAATSARPRSQGCVAESARISRIGFSAALTRCFDRYFSASARRIQSVSRSCWIMRPVAGGPGWGNCT